MINFIFRQILGEIINLVFRKILPEFHEILRNSNKCRQNFVFSEIFLEFRKIFHEFREVSRISNNFVKILCFAKFAQCCLAATLCRRRRRRGGSVGVPAHTALRTLPANADWAYIGVHLKYFPFCLL